MTWTETVMNFVIVFAIVFAVTSTCLWIATRCDNIEAQLKRIAVAVEKGTAQ